MPAVHLSYPVLFGYRDLVTGRNFVAFVKTDGRALLTKEDEGYWLSGVYPAALAGGGKEIAEASREFKNSYLSVLFDIAEGAHSFEAFKMEVETFFRSSNPSLCAEWEEARNKVKSGEVSHNELPRRDADSMPPCVEVQRLVQDAEHEPATYNAFDEFVEAA